MSVMRQWFAAAAVSLLAVGCAAAPAAEPGAGAPEGASIITVENNLSSFSDVTVYIEPQSGVRTSLGTVRTGTTENFTYAERGAITLVAQPVTGSAVTSERVTIASPSQIRWVLNTNRLTQGRRR